ncbi:MAG: hypothetical protein ABSC25_05530 [Roseiarcus sp.]|jgi:hypothetical protein
MKSIALLALLPSIVLASPSFCQETSHTIGSFVLTVENNPFGHGRNAFADTGVYNDHGMFLRCLDNVLSVAIVTEDQKWTPGDRNFRIAFRADDKDIIYRNGVALTDTLIEILDSGSLLDAMSGAKSAAFRLTSAVSVETFSIPLRQSTKAVAVIKNTCADLPDEETAPPAEETTVNKPASPPLSPSGCRTLSNKPCIPWN